MCESCSLAEPLRSARSAHGFAGDILVMTSPCAVMRVVPSCISMQAFRVLFSDQQLSLKTSQV